jgi:hypothetical protein
MFIRLYKPIEKRWAEYNAFMLHEGNPWQILRQLRAKNGHSFLRKREVTVRQPIENSGLHRQRETIEP